MEVVMKYMELKTVLAVYEECSFSQAAKRLYVSQPAVSQNITHLENELNHQLFIRDNAKIVPTPTCEKFVKYAKQIEDLWNALEKEIKCLPSETNSTLHIGTTSFFFRFLSHKLKELFPSKDNNIPYTIIEDNAFNIERMTNDGLLDFCFTRSPLYFPELMLEPLFTEEILFALPINHPACKDYPICEGSSLPFINLSDFTDSPFIMINNPRITPLCMKMCREAGFEPHISLQPVSWEHVSLGINVHASVGFLSNLHIRNDNFKALRFFRINSKHAQLQHVAAYSSSRGLTKNGRKYINSFRTYINMTLNEWE
jgi:DNA-binding transcriptional LysR family regulator